MSDDPIMDFTNVAGRDVFVSCSGLPAGASLVLVNKTSRSNAGQMAASNGPVTFHLSDSVRAGEYYLKGVDSTGGYLAQSVGFTVADTELRAGDASL
jgi:hypothetical protein